MFFGNLARKAASNIRGIHTTGIARSGHDTRDIFGSNLPFPVENKAALIALFIVYCSSGVAVPSIAIRKMILSKAE